MHTPLLLTLSSLLSTLLLSGCGPGAKPGSPPDPTSTSGDSGGGDSAPDESVPVDADNDGFNAGEDCDDGDPAISPAATEVCDGVDNDCDGDADGGLLIQGWLDGDGDGYGDPDAMQEACELPADHVTDGTDCDDDNNTVHPEAPEACDGLDQDCDGLIDDGATLRRYADADGDGSGDPGAAAEVCAEEPGLVAEGTDCDDRRASVHPGAAEVCGGLDDDCDGLIDDADPDRDPGGSAWYADADGDGYGDPARARAACDPGADEVSAGSDCDDGDPAISPGAQEVCDAADADEDCSGAADDADAGADPASTTFFYADADLDGYGGSTGIYACDATAGYVADSTDCDDAAAATHPGAQEVCDALDADEDCDGAVDDADPSSTGRSTFYLDSDSDGWGGAASLQGCEAPAGYVAVSGDCADLDAAIRPSAAEVCDAADTDEDCDGSADDLDGSASSGSMTTFWQDGDGDGYGGTTSAIRCDPIANFIAAGGDCADLNAAVNPAAQEVCDAADTDEDCDGLADDADSSVSSGGFSGYYADRDGDGWGDPASSGSACDRPVATVTNSYDCNDLDAAISPSAREVCSAAAIDEDCDGLIDDLDGTTLPASRTAWYTDSDGDGYGGASNPACVQPAGTVATGGDCNDTNAAYNPAATEICETAYNRDENCNGLSDNNDPTVDPATLRQWYRDLDQDGYGDGDAYDLYCDLPDAYHVLNTNDCDDTDPSINDYATEICQNGVDENCDIDCRWQYYATLSTASLTLTGVNATAAASLFGSGFGAGEDLNGDGYDDLLVSDPLYDAATMANAGRAYVLSGGAAGLTGTAAAPVALISGDEAGGKLGSAVAMLPDIDGDGDGEIVVGAYLDNAIAVDGGQALLFKGPLTSTALTPASAFLQVNASGVRQYLGWQAGAAGDQSGDGVEDWAVSAYGASSLQGRVSVISGAQAGGSLTYDRPASTVSTILGSAANDRFGSSVMAMDVDGDGLKDLIVSAAGADLHYVYLNGISGSVSASVYDYRITGTDQGAAASGAFEPTAPHGIDNAGDTDGDGQDDLIVGSDMSTTYNTEDGVVYLFAGPITSNLATTQATAAIYTVGNLRAAHAGRAVAGAGDVNGDGFADILYAAPGQIFTAGTVGFGCLEYGPMSGTMGLVQNGALLNPDTATMETGYAVAGAGDPDGDGFDDFAISSSLNSLGVVSLYYGNDE